MPAPVLYESRDLLIINKPANVSMHQSDSVLSIKDMLADFGYLGLLPCHRLDNGTSGCLIFARHAQAADIVRLEFENKQVEKTYLALSDKRPKRKHGKIVGDMRPARAGNYMLCMNTNNPAVTLFKSVVHSKHKRLYICKPITGKTHQIRVALKSNGSPIIGDDRYKGSASDRLYLHSYAIKLNYLGESIAVTCLPKSGEFFETSLLETLLSKIGQI